MSTSRLFSVQQRTCSILKSGSNVFRFLQNKVIDWHPTQISQPLIRKHHLSDDNKDKLLIIHFNIFSQAVNRIHIHQIQRCKTHSDKENCEIGLAVCLIKILDF